MNLTPAVRHMPSHAISAAELLAALQEQALDTTITDTRFATGMQPLDDVLGGGFRRQDLVLLTGRPGIGKTITALQWARECARRGNNAIYICYEHAPEVLLARLFVLEMAANAMHHELPAVDVYARSAHEVIVGGGAIESLRDDPYIARAYENLQEYAHRLRFVAGTSRTGLDTIDDLTRDAGGRVAVFVDYLQKVSVPRDIGSDDERAGYIGEQLKEIASTRDAAIIAVTAADRESMTDRRVRAYHMRGASGLAYEADLIMTLNDKSVAVSRSHLAFDPVRAESFRRQVVLSVEKFRNGPSGLDIDFTKDYSHYRLEPEGTFLTEKLVDDVLYLD